MTLYRGVNESHALFADQAEGLVIPNRRWWQFWVRPATAFEHNAVRGGTLYSPATSWTTDPRVALNFALRPNGAGVVLKAEIPLSRIIPSPNLKTVWLIQGGGEVSEAEVLVRGVVRAMATKVP
jgi:hypothetical protein